jgi:cytochrome c biogenesis protein CcdA/thiol-disulfide isomerase/thioredoxin
VLASAEGARGRPYAVVAGLVTSFTVFTLTATALLDALGLPEDTLRAVAIAAVLVVGASLVWPGLARVLERPFLRLVRRQPGGVGGGFALGASLGLLFTPCAGPVIAAVAALAATRRVSLDAVLVTVAYALGAGVVLLAFAVAAQRGLATRAVRTRARAVRPVLGLVVVAAGALMLAGVDRDLQTRVPGYTRALQGLEESAAAADELGRLTGQATTRAGREDGLAAYGAAPEFAGIVGWLNSPPLTLAGLRGKVVLVDFWTYSCVNCLRTLPWLRRWDETYRDRGLVIVGVHTPEFAFERDAGNVRDAVRSLGIRYPVALDPDYGTWLAWGNRYWPAKFLIDRRGIVRYAHFGEGAYEEGEAAIRTLLAESGLPAPVSASVHGEMPAGPRTPELYLGYARAAGLPAMAAHDREATYELPPEPLPDAVGLGGRWTIERERAVAGRDARLRLRFLANAVHLVLGGAGTVRVRVDGRALEPVRLDRPRLYTLARIPGAKTEHVLDLAFTPGVEAYAFTFG